MSLTVLSSAIAGSYQNDARRHSSRMAVAGCGGGETSSRSIKDDIPVQKAYRDFCFVEEIGGMSVRVTTGVVLHALFHCACTTSLL